jgi:hypothetical protein
MRKGEIMTQYKVVSQHLPGDLRNKTKTLVGVAGVPAEIRSWHHRNRSIRVLQLKQPVRNTEVHYCVHKRSPPEPTLSQFHPLYILKTYCFTIHFNIIILPIWRSIHGSVYAFNVSYVLRIQPITSSDHRNNAWWWLKLCSSYLCNFFCPFINSSPFPHCNPIWDLHSPIKYLLQIHGQNLPGRGSCHEQTITMFEWSKKARLQLSVW